MLRALTLSLNQFVRGNYTNTILNFLGYMVVYTSLYSLNFSSLKFDGSYFITSGCLLISLIFGASVSKKFNAENNTTIVNLSTKLYSSTFFSLFCLAILLYFLETNQIIRITLISTIFLGLTFESFYFLLFDRNKKRTKDIIEYVERSNKYLILDGLVLSTFCVIHFGTNIISHKILDEQILLTVLIYLSWVLSAATTHKFIPIVVSNNRLHAFELQTKFYLRIIALVILSILLLQIDFTSAIPFIKILMGYAVVSGLLFIIIFSGNIKNKTDEATVVFLRAYEMQDSAARTANTLNGNTKYSCKNNPVSEPVAENKFNFEYLKENGEIFSVLNHMLDLSSFDTRRTIIQKSENSNDIQSIQNQSLQLFVDLQVLNDQMNLNDHLFRVRSALSDGGVFVGAFLPHHYRYLRYLKNYSYYKANMLYFLDFIWKRVMPKLPITREIYFTFSKPKDRAISLAEGLGRLVYSGFNIINLATVNNVVYFTAVKQGTTQQTDKFFYSPLFKMKRIGKGGKPIYVYKLRTMYPYSEYIQDFVFKHNKLDGGGKFKDDFRVPTWGKLFRKLWIDELPMLINLLKGDLKFVGVRPISDHYLSLYSKEHQERRIKFKPGLFPPFYADMPKTLEEIELSEKRYLDLYEKKPLRSDLKYLMKGLNNILIKKKRSA